MSTRDQVAAWRPPSFYGAVGDWCGQCKFCQANMPLLVQHGDSLHQFLSCPRCGARYHIHGYAQYLWGERIGWEEGAEQLPSHADFRLISQHTDALTDHAARRLIELGDYATARLCQIKAAREFGDSAPIHDSAAILRDLIDCGKAIEAAS